LRFKENSSDLAPSREKDGYTKEEVHVYVTDEQSGEERLLKENVRIYKIHNANLKLLANKAWVYVGHISNPSFVGWQPMDELAEHIYKSAGPSGPNKVRCKNP